ncbi:NADH-quinone oxidoreductase subunit C [Streptomyces sp. TP-A0874]|uniref:NADH-quinone oxidoreductase subunit C n=1 Tax=Streptomyces sp. TP-A0874 TaxID=549819 RepID=UPI00099F900F|nr:NADH-quinone oxidoreductase subunit C [Streptomyces sp. TP-A0874]
MTERGPGEPERPGGPEDAAPQQPQPPVGWLPEGVESLFGPGATAEEAYGLLTVDVPAERWPDALRTARDRLGCSYFDWLSATHEPEQGFLVCAHLVSLAPTDPRRGRLRRLLLRTAVPQEAPALPTATDVYAGAGWHERETHEMFGIDFTGHPHLAPLLLPEGFEGRPLRKDFVLAARVSKAWPGAKEPGESEHGGPRRRQSLPPGVPDPNEWGPMKGRLPPAAGRTGRGARTAGAGERPARRDRSAGGDRPATEQAPEAPPEAAAGRPPGRGGAGATARRPRRNRSAGEGSASQRPSGTGAASPGGQGTGGATASDAPWHHPTPAFEEQPPRRPEPERPEPRPRKPQSGTAEPDASAERDEPDSGQTGGGGT